MKHIYMLCLVAFYLFAGSVSAQNSQQVTAIQYYFNTDPGIGNAGNVAIQNITATSNYNQNIPIIVPNSLNAGFNTLFLRVKDEYNRWSLPDQGLFFIKTDVNFTAISAYQYFFDLDPGIGTAGNGSVVSVTPSASINPTITITVPNNLSNGFHQLFIRTKSTNGIWSIAERSTFYINNAASVKTQTITALEYYYDIDPGVGNGTPYNITAASTLNFTANIVTPCLAIGDHYLYVRAKDDFGKWSIIERDTFSITSGISPLTVSPAGPLSICNNSTVTLSTTNVAGTAYQWLKNGSVISGETGTSYIVTSSGNYAVRTVCGLSNITSNIVSVTVQSLNTFYRDLDGDTYGDPNVTIIDCNQPSGYVSNNTDCNDNDVTVHAALPYYVDADHDGFGSTTATTYCSLNPPVGYSTVNTDCNDANPLEKPGQVWYIDADADGYGRNGVALTQCTRPLHGYVASELVATTGDCDDNNNTINASTRYFTFTNNTNFTNSIVSPLTGSSYTSFHFEVDYFDTNNALPAVNFPRLQLDYEGNGIYTDANDRLYLMNQDNPSDINTNDGKRYSININGLPAGTNWTARIYANDIGSCTTGITQLNAMDILEQPNLVIFANDINFSPIHPNPGDIVHVSALVHNASDYPAQNFYMHLTNQYDSINFTYPDILVSNLPARTATLVTWTITSPLVAAWVPMEVKVDNTNTITETNELDNRALRPFLNGNFNLPGGIHCGATVNPHESHSAADNKPVISGDVYYYGTAVPLQDTSVAGATVTFTIVETNTVFTCYTGADGHYSCAFPGPIDVGLYHVHVSVSDYTLTGSCDTATFRILPSLCLADLTTSVVVGYTGGLPGNSMTGVLTVTNNGCAAAGPSLLRVWQSGGTPVITSENVGALLPGQSQSFNYGPIIVNNPGTFSICAYADYNYDVTESSETNNNACSFTPVYDGGGFGGGGGGFGDVGSSGFSGSSANSCDATYFTISLNNSGTSNTGPFNVQVKISKNGILQTTLTQSVSGITALSSTYVTFLYNYASNGPGNYTYEVITDVDNNISETNETNNTSFYSNTLLPCKPTLEYIKCDSITTSPANVAIGNTVTLSGNIINSGDAPAIGPVSVRFNYSTGANYTAFYNGNIAKDQSVAVSVNAPVPPAGTTVTAVIDPLNQISEASEGGHVVSAPLCYDFSVDTLCGTDNIWDGNYNLFETVNLRAGIKNAGLLSATNLKVRFQISGPGITGTLNLGDATIAEINKTCKCPVAASLPNGYVFTANGLYVVTITVDPTNDFVECDETNNVKVVHVIVTDLPEMRVLSQYINPSLLNPDVNQQVTFDVTYENVGRENLDDSMRLNFLADNILINSVFPLYGLPKNAHATIPITTPWSSSIPGIHLLRAIIDADSIVDESNELNNDGTRAIVVGQSANLFFQSFTASNLAPSLHSIIDINSTIGNSGDLPCEADVQYYYKNGNVLTPISTLQHVVVAANSSVAIPVFSWNVSDNATLLYAKIINATSLEYTDDDNKDSLQIGAYSLSIITTPEACPNAANGTATASASGGYAPYSYLWSDNTGVISSGSLLTAKGGIYRVVVTDNSGQTVSNNNVIITTTPDLISPVFHNCPSNITQCDPIVTWAPPTATDNCGVGTINADHNPGETFPLGATTVHYSVTDVNGNAAACSFVITITAPPVWFIDADGDGFHGGNGIPSCTIPATGYSTTVIPGGDCNDANASINPYANEICNNNIDDNCDGIIDNGCTTPVTLNLHVLLQGFYLGNGLMQPVLYNLFPLINDADDVDSITIELHNQHTLALVRSDNVILNTSGAASIIYTPSSTFPASIFGDEYFIVVKHRNSVETWSYVPVSFSENPAVFDFTHYDNH